MNNLIQIYSQLVALRENVPQEKHINRNYVDQYNSLIDKLATGNGISLDDFKVPESELEHTSGVFKPGTGFQPFGEKKCERGFLLAKLDAVLILFKLKDEKSSIGFQPPEET